MNSLNVYLMQCDASLDSKASPDREEFDHGLAVVHYRPSHDTTPDHLALVTDSELATLRSRISAYLSTCRARRLAECGDEESLGRRLTHPRWRDGHEDERRMA